MEITLAKDEKRQLRLIASFYGCKVKFKKDYNGGTWHGDYIVLGPTSKSLSRTFTTFFHEIAHFINWKTGKYPIYHNPKNFMKMKKFFPKYGRLVRYSLNAEIYTEKAGARLMKEWLGSRFKYQAYYRNAQVCYEFLYGYNLRL